MICLLAHVSHAQDQVGVHESVSSGRPNIWLMSELIHSVLFSGILDISEISEYSQNLQFIIMITDPEKFFSDIKKSTKMNSILLFPGPIKLLDSPLLST